MFIRSLLILLSVSALVTTANAQVTPCTTLGQNPGTAFPVCGTSVYSQGTVPICGGTTVPSQCIGSLFQDKNPFWYKFTCFSAGTLGFVITPNILMEDYDWQLFDVTNHNPADIYTDPSLFVACDWSGDLGQTGASADGNTLVHCDGPGVPLFTSMPTLILNHNYILLVSHFSDGQSGYSLSFGGGTAVITDSTQPHLTSASASCDGLQITIALSKKMKCSSLAADGSNFTLSPAGVSIASAMSTECSTGFDMDSIVLTLNKSLATGTYTVTINNMNGQPLLDNCDNMIAAGENVSFNITPLLPTPFDSITTVGCAPDKLQLVFSRNIECSSIAPDGSDFTITGPTPVTISGATGNCNNGLATIINVQLAAPIYQQGTYQIKLVSGSDGNTIYNECGDQTPAGGTLNFYTKDTVSAAFTYVAKLSCQVDTINYLHDGRGGVNSWQWVFDGAQTSMLQNPSVPYSSFGVKNAMLVVSNGLCTDTASASILLDNTLKVSFEGTNLVCPGEAATFKDNSIGHIVSWLWDFGNGITSTQQSPPSQTYSIINQVSNIPVTLTVQDSIGCTDSLTQTIEVVNNCYIAVPSAFTPNNDGLNDYLYPVNAYKAIDLTFKVFNRFGQMVFETNDWNNKWNGTFKGVPADAGAYVWLLQYTDKETGKQYFTKGISILIR
jgi:gliding motility-associated-like protein